MVFDLLKSQKPIKEQAVHIIDHQVAELAEILWLMFWQVLESLTILRIRPNVLHDTCSSISVPKFTIVICLFRVNVNNNKSMHQVLLQSRIGEEVVLIELVLLLMALAHLLLRHNLLQEINETNTHVRIRNSPVENDRYGTCQLCLEVLIHSII